MLLFVSVSWAEKLGEYFETYIFQDWGFARFLVVPIILDTFLGAYRAKKQGKFKWGEFDRIIDKLISYMAILILVHVMTSFTVADKNVTIFHWMRVAVFSALMVKEAYSILKNIAAMNKSYVPVWLLERFKQFDKSGKFTIEEDEKEENDKNLNKNDRKDVEEKG